MSKEYDTLVCSAVKKDPLAFVDILRGQAEVAEQGKCKSQDFATLLREAACVIANLLLTEEDWHKADKKEETNAYFKDAGGGVSLIELSAEYESSGLLLKGRISELQVQLKEMQDPIEVRRLSRRLHTLQGMSREMKSIGQLLAHYYERGFYRDGRYCLQRDGKAARSRSASVPKANRRNERRSNRPAQEKLGHGNRPGFDEPATADVVAVLFQGLHHGADR